MSKIMVIYDDGSNGLVKVTRAARKQRKTLCEMGAQEIMATGFGMFR